MSELQNGLPAEWDSRYDEEQGRYYYINHHTKTTTWADPRTRHNNQQGTPKHLMKNTAEYIPLQEVRTVTRSPLTLRGSRVQDSSFTSSHSSTDSDDSVAKLSAMFPTVSEAHIKLLLKNCRYMKSIFPKADETIILECLQNNDNSIQKTSEILKEMGYSKKETMKPVTPKLEPKVIESIDTEPEKPKTPPPAPKIKTNEEKQQMKQKLQAQYEDVPEHLISIALESVNFNENRANQILQIMKQEDSEIQNNKNRKSSEPKPEVDSATSSTSQTIQIPVSQSRQSIKSLLKSEKKDDVGFSRIVDESNHEYRSPNLSSTMGHNPEFCKGPNEKLLLENYIQWQGSNKSFQKGPQGVAKGPNKNLLSTKLYVPCGPNASLRKGSSFGLAKGRIFPQMKAVVVGQSDVK